MDTEDSFWDLPLYFKIVTIGAVIAALGWKIVAILTAWMKKDTNNESRLKILHFIENNPGTTSNTIEKDLGFKRGTVRYHVKNLKDAGKILMIKNGKSISIFKNEMGLLKEKKEEYVEPRLQNRLCKQVCYKIFENPGITTTELAQEFDVNKSTIHVHVKTLKEMDCLNVEKDGLRKHYYLKEEQHPDSLQFFEKLK